MNMRVRLLIILLLIIVVIQSVALVTILSSLSTQRISYYNQPLRFNALPDETNLTTAPVLFYTAKINGVSGSSNRAINYTVMAVNPNNVPVVYYPSANVTLLSGNTKIYSRYIALNMTLTGPIYVPPLSSRSFYTGTIELPPNTPSGAYWLIASDEDARMSFSPGEILRNRIIPVPTSVVVIWR